MVFIIALYKGMMSVNNSTVLIITFVFLAFMGVMAFSMILEC
jgi:hypothetical protein